MENPNADRLDAFAQILRRRRVDAAFVFGEANVRALTGVACDNACLAVLPGTDAVLVTDFRYVPMARRVAPWLKTVELKRGTTFAAAARAVCAAARVAPRRLGYEGALPTARFLEMRKAFRRAAPVDVEGDVLSLRAVKTVDEITRIAAAAALNDEIWARARKERV